MVGYSDIVYKAHWKPMRTSPALKRVCRCDGFIPPSTDIDNIYREEGEYYNCIKNKNKNWKGMRSGQVEERLMKSMQSAIASA